MTTPAYLNNTYLFESQGTVTSTGNDKLGQYLVLDKTIFYPQGGGQPSDQGVMLIDGIDITIPFVKQYEHEIRHYITDTDILKEWQNISVICKVDEHRRILNAKYHTAGHLLSNVIENINPHLKATKGHSFPGEAYCEFIGSDTLYISNQAYLQNTLIKVIKSNLSTQHFEISQGEFEEKFYKLPYSIPDNKVFRVIQIGDYMPIPCGGTHLATLAEISSVLIRKIAVKSKHIKISYEVT